mmetsp:Transcript_30488/g.73051  ORF Transcript_30488/g.73051 Transcript_30488/m.73051 type:complete len:218 (+) Transcript_30488:261-914(+)
MREGSSTVCSPASFFCADSIANCFRSSSRSAGSSASSSRLLLASASMSALRSRFFFEPGAAVSGTSPFSSDLRLSSLTSPKSMSSLTILRGSASPLAAGGFSLVAGGWSFAAGCFGSFAGAGELDFAAALGSAAGGAAADGALLSAPAWLFAILLSLRRWASALSFSRCFCTRSSRIAAILAWSFACSAARWPAGSSPSLVSPCGCLCAFGPTLCIL